IGYRFTRRVYAVRSSSFWFARRRPPRSRLFPYTTLFRSQEERCVAHPRREVLDEVEERILGPVDVLEDEHQRLGLRELRGHPLRSEEHTSELQSRGHLVCRLLLEKTQHIGGVIICNLNSQ